MNALKRTIQANRGVASLLLLFVFLYAGLFRNSVINLSIDTKTEFAHKKVNSRTGAEFSQLDDDAAQALQSQFKKAENDLDDAEIITDFNFLLRNSIAFFQSHDFFRFDAFKSYSKLHLYDLFCNWKFHLL